MNNNKKTTLRLTTTKHYHGFKNSAFSIIYLDMVEPMARTADTVFLFPLRDNLTAHTTL